MLGEAGRHPVPHQMCLRNAVQEQHRRPAAAASAVDLRAGRLNVEFLKPIEHGTPIPSEPDIAILGLPSYAAPTPGTVTASRQLARSAQPGDNVTDLRSFRRSAKKMEL